MKKIFIVFFTVLLFTYAYGDNLASVSGTGSNTTASANTYYTVATTTTIDVTDIVKVLVYSTFTTESVQTNSVVRVATYRIIETGTPAVTSNEIQRYLQKDKTGDKGVGSLVYIFDVESETGNKTYTLQHQVSIDKDILTSATITAIALTTDSANLESEYPTLSNDIKTIITGETTASTSFTGVAGLTSLGISLATDGDILALASINTSATVGTDITGEWTLQRSPNGTTGWTSFGETMSRILSSTSDIGIANITHLDNGLAAGTYYYRLAHKTSAGTIETSNTSLAIVALGYLKGGTEVRTFDGTTTNSLTNNPTSSQVAVTLSSHSTITAKGSSLLLLGQFGVSVTNSETANFSLSTSGGSLTANPMLRFLDDADFGSGAIVGLVTVLTPSSPYNFYLQHYSTGGVQITSSAVEFIALQLTDTYVDGTLPVTLSSFTAQYLNDTPTLCWTTQSETSNAGWNIYRGETSEALSNEEAYLLNLSLGLIPGAGSTSEPTDYSFEDFFPIYAGNTYFYWLESVDYSGESEMYGPISLTIPENEWENPNSPEIPKPYGLHQNYPNPFNPSTEISFMMKESCFAELSIYNVKGEKIKTIFTNESIPRDELKIYNWNGKDESSKEVSTGVYYYKLRTTKGNFVRKMILLK